MLHILQFNFKSLEEAAGFKNNTVGLNAEEVIKFADENNITFNNFTEVAKDEVLDELSDVIYTLQENSMSSVVETTLAKHIIIVSKIHPEFQKTIIQ